MSTVEIVFICLVALATFACVLFVLRERRKRQRIKGGARKAFTDTDQFG